MPIFDYLFDPARLVPASEVGSWRGVQSGMLARRDHDPGAFLHEIVNIDPEHATCFALDPATACWTRAFVPWDPNATLICCDPPGMSKLQIAESALREMSSASDTQLLTKTLDAAFSAKWLPQDHFAEALHEKKHTCQALRLHQLGDKEVSASLRAIRNAMGHVDIGRFYASPDVAQARLRDALPEFR